MINQFMLSERKLFQLEFKVSLAIPFYVPLSIKQPTLIHVQYKMMSILISYSLLVANDSDIRNVNALWAEQINLSIL